MDDVKDLVNRYYNAQKAASLANELRQELVKKLKQHGLTTAKFNFNDRTIQYETHQDYEGISQKLLKRALELYYPQIDSRQFINNVCSLRNKKVVETIRVTKRTGTAMDKNTPDPN